MARLGRMEIPPNSALLNIVASLPAQGAAATASTTAKAAPAAATPPVTTLAGDNRSLLNPLPRGSILNIIA
jgi:hypothetical protein